MSDFAVIVQNDESKWDDVKGDLYHYPRTYKSILTPGCRIIYYKGKLKDKEFLPSRLSPEAHYFGIGIIGNSIEDPESSKRDRYCEILNYQEFAVGIPHKVNNEYLEEIPAAKETNYWRFGVREISQTTYKKILAHTSLRGYTRTLPSDYAELESYDFVEGQKRVRFSAYYERNPFYRNRAIAVHGLSCMVCRFNFETVYGVVGKGFIHVHHNKPISESGPTVINPQTDLSVVCPNCHAMIHRDKNHTLSVQELREKMESIPRLETAD